LGAVSPNAASSSPDAPLQWRTAPSIIRAWAFPLNLVSLLLSALTLAWGVSLFKTSATTGIAATGGALISAAIFAAQSLALRRGWGFGWALQLVYSGGFLALLVLSLVLKFGLARADDISTPAKIAFALCVLLSPIHLWITLRWFRGEVRAWFGKSLKVL